MKKNRFIAIIIATGVLLFSCKNGKKAERTDTLTQGIAEVAVDECFAPILEEEINVFESLYREASVIPTYTSDARVYDLLMKDSIRLIIGTRELTDNEKAVINERKQRVRKYRIAIDAIALITNKANPDTLLSLDALKGIVTGKVTNWKSINPASKLDSIAVIFDSPNSSTIRFIKDSICGGAPVGHNLRAIAPESETVDINQVMSNAKVIQYVAANPNALGVIGVNWISNPNDTTNLSFINDVNVISLSREDDATPKNSFKPFPYQMALELAYRENRDSEQKGTGGYPLTRNIYAIITDAQGGLSSGFFNFVANDRGQRIILKAGLLPANRPMRLVRINAK
ncbi:MAG: substrate-binding domain-containing protein [Dysgonamonadaceae bacterium]|jgi:phosphate transport system substrate-binding protein|nr:substrate-binding domain-containing protein [Dysgonamonadaceae bacterium]